MMQNALTIDLEDWYQGLTSTSRQYDRWPVFESRISANTDRLLEILSDAGVKATFFVLGYVADHLSGLVRKVADNGHEIALHSYAHERVNLLTPDQFREDLARGLDSVQRSSGKQVLGYRAPMFSINGASTWVLEELCGMGFRYDSSIFPIRNLYYGIPGALRFPYHPFEGDDFVEFPLSTVRFLRTTWPIAGGFYGRVLPYPVMRAGIRSLNEQGHPAVIYFHPWEFDAGQRFNQVTLRERITHYHGRSGLESKFKRLLQDFQFGPLSGLLENVYRGDINDC
jgi:polysaccharide deacetylase family protein (PEP-CTERM system associated)